MHIAGADCTCIHPRSLLLSIKVDHHGWPYWLSHIGIVPDPRFNRISDSGFYRIIDPDSEPNSRFRTGFRILDSGSGFWLGSITTKKKANFIERTLCLRNDFRNIHIYQHIICLCSGFNFLPDFGFRIIPDSQNPVGIPDFENSCCIPSPHILMMSIWGSQYNNSNWNLVQQPVAPSVRYSVARVYSVAPNILGYPEYTRLPRIYSA